MSRKTKRESIHLAELAHRQATQEFERGRAFEANGLYADARMSKKTAALLHRTAMQLVHLVR